MYFNDDKKETNIDAEFHNKKLFDFNKYKMLLISIGVIILIVVLIIIFSSKNKTSYYISLSGNKEMTVTQGSIYEDPGYQGFDKHLNDLTDQVVVDGTVDVSTVGTYTVTYKLYKTKVTRTVNVVPATDANTYIYLKGEVNMHLNVGTAYVEPGYMAIDTVDGDITNKVKVQSTVDTSKKGVYAVIYTVTNSNNISASETRAVIVE